jgi:hypothetical protein
MSFALIFVESGAWLSGSLITKERAGSFIVLRIRHLKYPGRGFNRYCRMEPGAFLWQPRLLLAVSDAAVTAATFSKSWVAVSPEKRRTLHPGQFSPNFNREINSRKARHRDIRYQQIGHYRPGGHQCFLEEVKGLAE